MATVNFLVDSGLIVLIALAFLAVESLLLIAAKPRRLATRTVLVNAGAGGSLMLALGASLRGLGAGWIAACLLLALVFHLADLAVRWRDAGRS